MNEAAQPQDFSHDEWRSNLAKIGAKEGFFEELGEQHSALYVARGKTLIISFENLDHVYENDGDRMPWGFDFVEKRGWSMLGMMAHDWTWYRDEHVFAFFDRLRDDGFFDQFEKVVFYGASMGAYAACVFSSAVPGATVIAISPQATLDRRVASWESRYRKAWRRDFTGSYSYAPDMVATAKDVHLFFDPLAPLDAMHACLFQGDNVVKYSCRFMGHRIASLWLLIGILKEVSMRCVDGSLTTVEFYAMVRKRREVPRYQRETLDRLKARGGQKAIVDYCTAILNRRRGPVFRRELNEATKRLAAGKTKR